VKSVDLGETHLILEPGKTMMDNPLVKLPPGRLVAHRVISTEKEKNYSLELQNTLD
jgi:hypothetical protein